MPNVIQLMLCNPDLLQYVENKVSIHLKMMGKEKKGGKEQVSLQKT